MVDFADWEMPVEYSGVIEEHMAVRQQAGLFDVSHMGEIEVTGRGALNLVQRVTCNDASRLAEGRSQYSALLTPEGTFVDDIMVYRLAADHFLLCVNASNTTKDFEWILSQKSGDVRVENRSDDWGLLAIQGPRARQILPSPLKKTFFEKREVGGNTVILSATGYTGEDGYELFCRSGDLEKLWRFLFDLGRGEGLIPCGLAARDTLRLEAAYPLYGHEIDDKTTPFEADLSWVVKMEKGEFIGREALREVKVRKKLAGLQLTEPGIARQGYRILQGESEVGQVTSGTWSPYLKKAIALGFLGLTTAQLIGIKLGVDIRGKKREAEVVSLPFYSRRP